MKPSSTLLASAIPLSLYIHVPWCVRKCLYCDFNSHAQRGDIPQARFAAALLSDFQQSLGDVGERSLRSIFIGGGTPSLLSATVIETLLSRIRSEIAVADDMEVTLEANPGTADAGHFAGYRAAGVNRLSIGVQSFGAEQLKALGRIHNPADATDAISMARDVGFDNINLDLMFGLPGQSLEQALRDVSRALEATPEHISYYQLTLEPNTLFYRQPPILPGDESIWDIQEQGQALLAAAGYGQYEVSAYAREGRRCRHNLNYWRFGDYLGVGPGAHGKMTLSDGTVRRDWKLRHPEAYLAAAGDGAFSAGSRILDDDDLLLEFLMNALRLKQGFETDLFEARTGLPFHCLEAGLAAARKRGLIDTEVGIIRPTERGFSFLNELLALFDE